ncbi:hypothetical protein [Lacrimispora saccharolytica]|nr:hypothetical protein [Lacrimispora saccharolytica]QRV18448.1 hypothetical protein I6K70_12915 [Lacrimispora saccharolytica]
MKGEEMREEDSLLINVHNLLTIGSFILDQAEKNLKVLGEILSSCEKGKRDSINRCVLFELTDSIDLMVLCEEIDKNLSNPLISPECMASLNNLKKETRSIICNLKVLENALSQYTVCPLMTNGHAIN